jgi:hypothetical protein
MYRLDNRGNHVFYELPALMGKCWLRHISMVTKVLAEIAPVVMMLEGDSADKKSVSYPCEAGGGPLQSERERYPEIGT